MPSTLPEGLRPGGRFAEWRRRAPVYVVADVDGTLIAQGTTATPVVAAAVADAHAAGLRVGFATGRLPVGVRDLHGQLAPDGPHIVHNGAQVRLDARILKTWPLERDAARRLVDLCRERKLYTEFYVVDAMYVTERTEAARPSWDAISGEPDGLIDEIDLDTAEIIKATVVVFEPSRLPGVLAGASSLGLLAEAAGSPVLPGAMYVNVNSPEANKGTGLAFAAEHLGISLDETVAVGDSANDVSMLSVAGTAVAMGQAPAEVQEVAHVIVPEVEQDGVAHALRAAAEWRAAGPDGS